MARRQMWMGLRGRERWVPAPATGMDSSPVGWTSSSSYLNGGAGQRSSFASHREYDLSWNQNSRDALRPIMDMANGLHGQGRIYFLDPMTLDKNVLPVQWSFPALAAMDGPVLWGTARPASLPTESNNLDYPYLSAQYAPTDTRASLYIPVPAGWTAWVGWHGNSDDGGGVEVTPIVYGDAAADPVLPPVLSVNDDTRVNTAFPGSVYQGIELRFGGVTGGRVATIAGVMVQILEDGTVPQRGGFISGQGHSGCSFADTGKPKLVAYSSRAGIDGLVGMSAKLIETGDWE